MAGVTDKPFRDVPREPGPLEIRDLGRDQTKAGSGLLIRHETVNAKPMRGIVDRHLQRKIDVAGLLKLNRERVRADRLQQRPHPLIGQRWLVQHPQ